MNKVNLIGRICNDLELNQSGENKYTRFTLAVNRTYVNEDGTRPADFISCVAWNKLAEVMNEHLKKGSQIGVSGKIQTGSYDRQDGTKAYTTDIIVEGFDFLEKKEGRPAPEYAGTQSETQSDTQSEPQNTTSIKQSEIEISDTDLPF